MRNSATAMRIWATASRFTFAGSPLCGQLPSFRTLYTFEAKDNSPSAGLIGYGGALWGTTLDTIFMLAPSSDGGSWTETPIDAVNVATGISFGPRGEVYGITLQGGGSPACPPGCGTVFALTPGTPGELWNKHVLYAFQGNGDGALPTGAPVIGPAVDRTRHLCFSRR